MYPENPGRTQAIVGSMYMGYISDTARNRTLNLFRPKREPIPLGHSEGQILLFTLYLGMISLFFGYFFEVRSNILAIFDPDIVYPVRTVDSRSDSDHKLIIASLNIIPADEPESIHQTFHNLNNSIEFESTIRYSFLITDPAKRTSQLNYEMSFPTNRTI